MTPAHRFLFAAAPPLLLLGISGCASAPRLTVSPQILSSQWSDATIGSAQPDQLVEADLGKAFASDVMRQLIAKALATNSDIAISNARLAQAQAQYGAARDAMLPVVSASASLSATKTNRTGDPFDFTDISGALDATFTPDISGVQRARKRASNELLRAARFDAEETKLQTSVSVARTYLQYCALAARIALLDRNIAQARAFEGLIRIQQREGVTSKLDAGLQAIQLNQLQADRQRLFEAQDRTLSALAILVGEEAPRFAVEVVPFDQLRMPQFMPLSPKILPRIRPDIRAAEARIRAAGGDVDEARRAFLPQLQISARGLLQIADLGGALGQTVSIGSSLLAPIFDRARLNGALRLSRARQSEAVELYRKALLSAIADSNDAVTAIARSRQRDQIVNDMLAQTQQTVRMFRLQYKEGDGRLLDLLDVETRNIQAEDAKILSQLQSLESMIDLYRNFAGFVTETR